MAGSELVTSTGMWTSAHNGDAASFFASMFF